jgi:DNA (cytosine-5)-methyltransferase 1
LTIREAARLQGFSDDFIFAGTLSDQMQLVGNAVPLPLATALGQHIVNELGSVLPA